MKTSYISLAIGAGLLAACNSAPTSDSEKPISFLAFGDSGYHMDYIDKEDVEVPIKSSLEFEKMWREEWIEDKKPMQDYELPALHFHEQYQTFLPGTGMMPVANAMKNNCEQDSCDFAIMLGDNIYPDGATLGTDGHDDPTRFDTLFNKPFGKLGGNNPNFKTYVTLGNHDWNTSREGALAQVEYMEEHPAFYMDGLIYRVKPEGTNGDVELFIIDTELMLGNTVVYEDKLNNDGSEIRHTDLDDHDPWARPKTDLEKNQVQWLETALKSSTAKWKFVVAHHPIWASGGSKFEQGHAIRKLLAPTMCKYADAYFTGHEHSLEIHDDTCAGTGVGTIPILPNITSGAASKQRGMNSAFMAYQDKAYPHKITHFVRGMIFGFMRVDLLNDNAEVKVYQTPQDGSEGSELVHTYSFKRRNHLIEK